MARPSIRLVAPGGSLVLRVVYYTALALSALILLTWAAAELKWFKGVFSVLGHSFAWGQVDRDIVLTYTPASRNHALVLQVPATALDPLRAVSAMIATAAAYPITKRVARSGSRSHDLAALPLMSQQYRRRLLAALQAIVSDALASSLPDLEIDRTVTQGTTVKPGEPVLHRLKINSGSSAGSTNDGIVEVFDRTLGVLLLLGPPGAGKTTLLLELTHELIVRSQANQDLPVPVIFSLKSWASKKQSLTEWMADELVSSYFLSEKDALAWVSSGQILPLLEDLDQVAEGLRAHCVAAINEYRKEQAGLVDMVVCSRSEHYSLLARRLEVNAVVTLQPLTPERVIQYLAAQGAELSAALAAFRTDRTLRELVTTPFMLRVMITAYRGLPRGAIQGSGKLERRRQDLLRAYVHRTLKDGSSNDAPFSDENTVQWLAWLAHQMSRHSQSIFFLDRLQADLLETEGLRNRYAALVRFSVSLCLTLWLGLCFGLWLGLSGSPTGVDAEGYYVANVALLAAFFLIFQSFLHMIYPREDDRSFELLHKLFSKVLPPRWFRLGKLYVGKSYAELSKKNESFFAQLSPEERRRSARYKLWRRMKEKVAETNANDSVWNIYRIRTSEHLRFSRPQLLWAIPETLIEHVFAAILLWPISMMASVFSGTPIVSVFPHTWFFLLAPLFALFLLLRGLTHDQLQFRTHLNQGIHQSGKNAVRFGLLAAAVGGSMAAFISALGLTEQLGALGGADPSPGGMDFRVDPALLTGFMYGTLLGTIAALSLGGFAVIQHFALRIILAVHGYLPWNCVRFLDYADGIRLLRRSGLGYEFFHNLLADHFRQLDRSAASAPHREVSSGRREHHSRRRASS